MYQYGLTVVQTALLTTGRLSSHLRGPDALHLPQQPVLGRVKTLHVLLRAATLGKTDETMSKQETNTTQAAGRVDVQPNRLAACTGCRLTV